MRVLDYAQNDTTTAKVFGLSGSKLRHAIFDIKNRTHAYFGWHRNEDEYAVEADSLLFHNRYWKSKKQSSVASL